MGDGLDTKKTVDPQDVVSRPHMDGGGTRGFLISDNPDETYKEITNFLESGKADDEHQIPRLANSLDFAHKQLLLGQLEKLASRLSSDVFLELGEILDAPASNVLLALDKSKRPVSNDSLKRHLQARSASSMAWLTDDARLFAHVRSMFPGPMGIALPLLADFPAALHNRDLFAKWYIETTDPSVVALNFTMFATDPLALTLDRIDQWSWLDHLHIQKNFAFSDGLEKLRDKTQNQAAKAKIVHMFGTFTSDSIGMDSIREGGKDLDATFDNPDNDALLDAAARSTNVENANNDHVLKRMAGQPASVVLEFAEATSLDLAVAVPALAAARGLKPEHMQSLFYRHSAEQRVDVLKSDKLRAQIRRALGGNPTLTGLFPKAADREAAHRLLFADEALREWAYREKQPLTNLWIAAGSENATASCKLVGRELNGFGWVHQLPTSAPSLELRRLALNCGDAKTTLYVHEHLLGDRGAKVDPSENNVGPRPGDVYGDRTAFRVEEEVRNEKADQQHADPHKLLQRLGDLNPTERVATLKNTAELTDIFTVLSGGDAIRAVYLLAPTIAQALQLPLTDPALLDYIRSRPPNEELAAQSDANVHKAQLMFSRTSPLLVFPSLGNPKVLASAIAAAPELLEWMLKDMDPNQALALLGTEPAASAAAPHLEAREHVYKDLPSFKMLRPTAQRGFNALAKKFTDDESKDEAKDYEAGNTTADSVADGRAKRNSVNDKHDLAGQLHDLVQQHANESTAIAVIANASPADQIALLKDDATVAELQKLTTRSPAHLFHLTTAQFFAYPAAARWLLDTEPAYAILNRIHPGDQVTAPLAAYLESSGRWRRWLHDLSAILDSASLTVGERTSLDAMSSHVTNEDMLRALFKVRYGSPVDTTFGAAEVRKLWNVLARLPPAQANQQVIHTFTHGDIGDTASGMWYEHEIVLDDKGLPGNERSYEDSAVLTEAQVKQYYGLEGPALAKATGPGGWLEVVPDKTTAKPTRMYRVKEVTTTPHFDATVIHEVGHSVDTLLGEHTDLVYGRGGWKTFGIDQFEDWATQMGALKNITGPDRKEVITAWTESIRSGTPVNQLVDSKHPAMKADLKDPLVQAAINGDMFNYKTSRQVAHGDRVFVTHGMMLATVPKTTADVAPSEYSMSAPAEYFAECYVEYYRGYKGTPDTEKHKGGNLATWIKDWMTTHVDNVRLSPERITTPDDKSKAPKPKMA